MTCGTLFDVRKGNFSKTQSPWFKGNEGYMPICKDCLVDMFNYYTKKYNGDEDEAIKRIAMFYDLFYSEEVIDRSNHSSPDSPKINIFVGRLNMRQTSGKTFDTYLEEQRKLALIDPEKAKDVKIKVTPKMTKFWGPGYVDEDYLFLDEHYKDLIARHECKTRTQEILFKRIAKAELVCEKADLTGDTKKIKEANDNLQTLMGSANIKPTQTNDNTLAETNTLGTLIQKWEETEPIPEPAPEWADPDKIGKYFRVWVLGTLLTMFGLSNPFKEEYEDEVEKYRAKKPEFDDEDGPDTSIRSIIFGNQDGGSS